MPAPNISVVVQEWAIEFLAPDYKTAYLCLNFPEGQAEELPEDADAFDIRDIFVHPGLRNSGVGSYLMAEALALVDAAGAPCTLCASPVLEEDGQPCMPLLALVKFYEKFGFRPTHEFDVYWDNAVKMRRPISG